jgi:hypothetical protein
MSLEEYFSTGPAHERPVFEAVIGHLEVVGPVHVEPLSVGIYLKRAQTFATLTPRARWVALAFSLPRKVEHALIRRKVIAEHGRYWHVANLATPDDLDDPLREWLTEAYLTSPV